MRLAARRSAVQAATDAQRQLHALVVAIETAATAVSLPTLARRIHVLNAEIAGHTQAITTLVRAGRPDRLTPRRGPMVAAIVLCAWSHPGRCPTDAAFAMLAGPRPPGLQRPDRPGAPQPLRRPPPQPGPLHLIVLTRLRYDPATRA